MADNKVFFTKAEAYTKLNDLVGRVNEKLFENEEDKKHQRVYTEMLLFSIADNIIFEDILKSKIV